KLVQSLAREFDYFELNRVPRGENVCADALAALGSKLKEQVKRTIPIHHIDRPSISSPIEPNEMVAPITRSMARHQDSKPQSADYQGIETSGNVESVPDWRTELVDYLINGNQP